MRRIDFFSGFAQKRYQTTVRHNETVGCYHRTLKHRSCSSTGVCATTGAWDPRLGDRKRGVIWSFGFGVGSGVEEAIVALEGDADSLGSLAVIASADSALRLLSPKGIGAPVAVVVIVAVVRTVVDVGVSAALIGDLNEARFTERSSVVVPAAPAATGDLNGRIIDRELGIACGTPGRKRVVVIGGWFSFTVGGNVVSSVTCSCLLVCVGGVC